MKRRLLVAKIDASEHDGKDFYYVEANLVLPTAYVLHIDRKGDKKEIEFKDISTLPSDVVDALREWMDTAFSQ